jgi:hypothetical protein
MTRQMWTWVAACAIGCVAAIGTAHGQQLGFYVGGYYGQSDKNADIAPFDDYADAVYDAVNFTALQSSSQLDTKDKAFGFIAGYRLLPNLAFEGGYMNLGSLAYRATSTGAFGANASGLTLNVDTQTTGIALSALGVLPLSYRSEVYGRVGILFSTTQVDTFVSDGRNALRDNFSDGSTDYLAGVGGGFSFAEVYTIRLEYERVFEAGSKDTGGESDVDILSLGFTVAF